VLTYNVKLFFDNPEDEKRLLETLKAQRLAFNEGSKLFYDPKHPFGSKTNGVKELHNLFYRQFRDKYPHIPAQIVIRAEQDILAAYRSVKANKQKITAAPQKKRLSMRLDKHIYAIRLTDKIVNLTVIGAKRQRAVGKMIVYPRFSELLQNYSFADPLIFERSGEIFLSVTFKTPEKPVISEKAIGVDLGIKRLAALSDGRIIKDKGFNARKRQIRHLKGCLKSKGTKSAKRHLRKLKRRESNMTRNHIHLVANEILKTDASLIVLEDLKKLKRNVAFKNANKGQFGKSQNNRLSQIPLFALRKTLEYKAQALGKRVVTVSPYMTSQEDYRGLSKGSRQGCRYYGSDGTILDADLNAANNIVLKYPTKLPVSCSALDGQAVVKQPIIGM
jgi:putative transposase